METAASAIGIFGLAGFFNNAVDCFGYVQLGLNFGLDFQTSLLKLDDARLQLSRWGLSVGLTADAKLTKGPVPPNVPESIVKQAEARLNHIVELFAKAELTANGLKAHHKNEHGGTAFLDTNDLDKDGADMHHPQQTYAKRVKWALYEEKHFRQLIEDVTVLINGFTDLFPASKSTQQAICEAEVAAIGGQHLATLEAAIAEQNSNLKTAISKTMGGGENDPSNVFSSAYNSGFQVGNNRGTISGLTWGDKK